MNIIEKASLPFMALILSLMPHVSNAENIDFGIKIEKLLYAKSKQYFGITKPLKESAKELGKIDEIFIPYRTPGQSAMMQVKLAKNLKTQYVTRDAGHKTDMMVLWPEANPTHLITCVEGGREDLGGGKYNPSVQRIELRDGSVETILRGMDRCDGIRSTVWGTVLVTEEQGFRSGYVNGNIDSGTDLTVGGAYEIIDPLNTTEATVNSRETGTIDSSNVVKRDALPLIAWEGLTILPNGVVIAGDELRPGTSFNEGGNDIDSDGGAIFKFIPLSPRITDDYISDLDQSPLTAGTVYALQITCREGKQQYGQGCEVGHATWLQITDPKDAKQGAVDTYATGYYRPEDLHIDPLYTAPEEYPEGVRICWANTGREAAENYGEIMCAIDKDPLVGEVAEGEARLVTVNRFIEGDADFNSLDNLAFQPVTGNLYVIEDHPNGDIFACLKDGSDRDIKSDGCIKILSVKDSTAEPSGFFFTADGKAAYLSIQHSNDEHMPLFDNYGTDDILKITGFKVK